MCGITAYSGKKQASEILFESLRRLEYRGYDSAGIATSNGKGLTVKKAVGQVDEIQRNIDLKTMDGNLGVGHTRWATHGNVSKENAHPHTCCNKRFAVVHNGIVENWESLREKLTGCSFKSQTDSEVIAHYIEKKSRDLGVERAIQDFMEKAKGSFAVTLMDAEKDNLFAIKNGSPLAIGLNDNEIFVGSDVFAFSSHTDQAIFLGDYEYARIEGSDLVVKNIDGEKLEKKPRKVDWDRKESQKDGFDHYMHKEIFEIPEAIERLKKSLETEQRDRLKRFSKKVKKSKKIIFTASGTSYHASLLGVYFLQRAGIEAQTLIASEFKNYERVDSETLLIPISQSGETRDVLEAIEYSLERGAEVASITNVPHSTVERKSDVNLRIRAGQEVCVAATKTFTNQLYTLLKIAEELNGKVLKDNMSKTVEDIIEKNEPQVKKIAKELKDDGDIYIIGKEEAYPVAREIALKLKEIAYVHAEGMMGGELKHGTLALIENDTPVISLIPKKESEIVSNVKEVEARGARTIELSPFYGDFYIPEEANGSFAFLSAVIGFLLTYWIGRERGRPIDRPRNLAKSLTVK